MFLFSEEDDAQGAAEAKKLHGEDEAERGAGDGGAYGRNRHEDRIQSSEDGRDQPRAVALVRGEDEQIKSIG